MQAKLKHYSKISPRVMICVNIETTCNEDSKKMHDDNKDLKKYIYKEADGYTFVY